MGLPASIIEDMGLPNEAEAAARSTPPPVPPKSKDTETMGGGIVRTLAKGFGAAMGRNAEVARGLYMGEPLPQAIYRAFLPPEWADAISPQANLLDSKGRKRGVGLREDSGLTPENLGDVAASGAGRFLGGGNESPDIGPPTGPWNKGFRTMADFTGQALAQPIPGGPVPKVVSKTLPLLAGPLAAASKYIAGSAGAGAGSEVGGQVLKNTAGGVFGAGEEGQKWSEIAGQFMGAPVGSMVNNVRLNMVTKGTEAVTSAASNAINAYKQARALQVAGDERNIFKILLDGDTFQNVRAESKSILQQHVNETVAHEIAMDPQWQDKSAAFQQAAQKAGVRATWTNPDGSPGGFSLPQQTNTPSLVATVSQSRPALPEDAARLQMADLGPKLELQRVYKQVQNTVAPDADSVMKQMKELQAATKLRLTGLNREADAVAQETPALSASARIAQDEAVRTAAEAALKTATAEKDRLYQIPKGHDEQAQTPYDLKPFVAQAKAVLKDTFAQIKPDTVPDSTRALATLFGKAGGSGDAALDAAIAKTNPELFGEGATPSGKRITYDDINSAMQALNDEAHSARIRGQAGSSTARREEANANALRSALKTTLTEQAPPEVITAHNAAVTHFRENYAPRFREGVNANLFREAGAARQGEEYIPEGAAINAYLKKESGVPEISETRLRQFDRLFGGVLPGTERNQAMYGELWKGVEDNYSRTVLEKSKGAFNADAHEKFMREYAPAFDRLPALRDKLEGNADRITTLQEEAGRVEKNFETVAGSPLTSTFGPKEANAMIARGLADPAMMGRIISAVNQGEKAVGAPGSLALLKEIMLKAQPWKETPNGLEFDSQNLLKMLDAGRNKENPSAPGGLQVLFNAALGKAEGAAHMERLRALALLAQRVESTTPQFLRPQDPIPQGLVKSATGSSGASLLSDIKALVQGRTSGVYLAGVAGGRFANKSLMGAVNNAYQEALYNPQMSKDLLDLASKDAGSSAAKGVMGRIFGSGGAAQEFIKQLTGYGTIKQRALQSMLLTGAVEASHKDDEANK